MKALVPLFLALTLVTAAVAEDAPQADVNYAFGLLLGQSLASTGLSFDLSVVLTGIQDALGKGKTPRFDAEKAKEIVSTALQAAQDKANQVLIDKENAWLATHAKVQGVKTTASGLQYEVLQAGTGAKPALTDTVKVNFAGTLVDGTSFANTNEGGEPVVFPLQEVIPGWSEGLQLMPVGSKYRFTIPSKLAYGADGAGGVIPPFATVIFEVTLISIEPAAPAQ